ncbi:MAG: nucleotidyltransferase family protein [Pseudomonadota bacterium]
MQGNPGAPVVIVLAAGRGERFAASGGRVHKLQALLGGKPVMNHVLDAVKTSGLPFYVVQADPSRPGMGDSIAAGVRATPDAAGWLILPADLPLVKASTLLAMAAPSSMAVTVPVHKGERGHPVRFGAVCGPTLMQLEGSAGAASILKVQMAAGAVEFIDVDDAGVVTDIDTLDDLQRAEALLKQF